MGGTLNSKTPAAPSAPPAAAPQDRTSTIVTTTLIFLTGLGIATVFWEPLAALAVGAPTGAEPAGEPHVSTTDGGQSSATATSNNLDGSGNS